MFILGSVMVDKVQLALLEATFVVVYDFVVVNVVVVVNAIVVALFVVTDHIIFSYGQ